ncbi:N-acetylmuramoyl-L-alanine amidase [Paracoccus litorisediminis]|uniref:peptidoglycan recognition protein family protein n=1 Tax=Paracoccus litorisediminis TaxID=2006130 RepID=UPI00373415AA
MKRIILHWSAGGNAVSALDRQHYHFIIDGAGAVHDGNHKPEANASVLKTGAYAAHTLNCNTGSIGVALAGMAGAVDRPFAPGKQPITQAQIEALARLCADLCKRYGIPITRSTVLSHAEVQPTLGIAQRGKWDIAWLPGMTAPGDPVEVGDNLRARIRDAMTAPAQIETPVAPLPPTLQRGDVGAVVSRAQSLLLAAGFDPQGIDGNFGARTRTAVANFQTAKGLPASGIITAATWSALTKG